MPIHKLQRYEPSLKPSLGELLTFKIVHPKLEGKFSQTMAGEPGHGQLSNMAEMKEHFNFILLTTEVQLEICYCTIWDSRDQRIPILRNWKCAVLLRL